MSLTKIIYRLNKNKFFRFLSSIKLAVPLLVVLIVAVAVGTIYESVYNATYAQLAVYETAWFFILLLLLAINIFCAMMSRYPWKKNHAGFVITHIGLLVLLLGAYITRSDGIDGTLQIIEGESNSIVILPRLMLGYHLEGTPSVQSVDFKRSLGEKSDSDLDFLNDSLAHVFRVEKYLPFAEIDKSYVRSSSSSSSSSAIQGRNGIGVSFILQSPFFKNQQWLHTVDQPEIQLGPAHISLLIDNNSNQNIMVKTPTVVIANKNQASSVIRDAGVARIVVKDVQTKKELQSIPVNELRQKKKIKLRGAHGVEIEFINEFHRAVVAENKIQENPASDGPENPALELVTHKKGESQRNILYAKFPDFSVNTKGNFGLLLTYEVASVEPEAGRFAGHNSSSTPSASRSPGDGNLIEFHFDPSRPDQVRVVLWKNKEQVGERWLKEGQSFETPWMGMQITVASILLDGHAVEEARPVVPEPGGELPPAALFIRPADSLEQSGMWISQGENKTVKSAGRQLDVIFANQILQLPFTLKLIKFTKTDYPGTETPMSYESLVQVQDDASQHRISMNEPLQYKGFTLYQASYISNPGEKPITILSVNRDPGRMIKYLGSIILAIGIITFTLMRSRFYRKFLLATLLLSSLFSNLSMNSAQAAEGNTAAVSPEQALSDFKAHAEKIQIEPIRRLAVSQGGRIKPLDTLAREMALMITGSYSRFGLHAVQFYLALASQPQVAPWAQVIEVRDVGLRTQLGYLKDKRFFSLAELEASSLFELARPALKKREAGRRLNEEEKKILETLEQMGSVEQIIVGEHLLQAVDFSRLQNKVKAAEATVAAESASDAPSNATNVSTMARKYLNTLASEGARGVDTHSVTQLVFASQHQSAPELFQHYLAKLDIEVFYNDLRPFLWASGIALIIGLLFVLDITRKKLQSKPQALSLMLFILPLIPLILGIGLRVYITRFAPVTNMYGTMLWVSFGVILFSGILFVLYRPWTVSGMMLIGSGLLLMLAEQIPLVLSPDLDPLVAVLRSNFWLSTHVTTITISYAAFTIAMMLGNMALVQVWWLPSAMAQNQDQKQNDDSKNDKNEFIKDYAHYAYRMTQLGCFLLSVGTILGGVWADYSWGRFWGWDPKENWALIADLGYLALLHARYTGWVNAFTFLALCPVAYLLVLMAWYGVNFILATGLHSYGFSSGGALMVSLFVGVQVTFITFTFIRIKNSWRSQKV